MGAPRKLDSERTSLTDLVEEGLFTKLMIRNTPETKAQVAAADKLHADSEAQLAREHALQVTLLEAEVRIAIGNRLLDEGVVAFRGILESKEASGASGLFGRFFGSRRPSEVIKMALGSELAVVEPWIESLKADSDPELKAQGAALEKLVATGSAALSAHKAARQALRDFRAGPRAGLFDQVNRGRAGLYGELRELGKDAAWAESFFRVSRRAADEPEEPSVDEAAAALETQRAALNAAEARLEAAKQRAAAAQAATAAREAKEKEREATRREIAALRSRLAELDESLK